MSPEALESYNKYEGQNAVNQGRYHDLERGDIDPMVLANTQAQNQFSQNNTQSSSQSNFDPALFIKNLISAGFTPTKNQISNAPANLSGPADSTNTWFAIFLQKLMRQARQKK